MQSVHDKMPQILLIGVLIIFYLMFSSCKKWWKRWLAQVSSSRAYLGDSARNYYTWTVSYCQLQLLILSCNT
jgi:hypothetical protein